MGRMTVGANQRIWEGYAVPGVDNRRHPFQVDLVHDAVAWRNDIDVFKSSFGPINEMKTVVVTSIFDRAIFLEGVLLETRMFNRERVIDNQLSWHNGIDLGRIAAFRCNGITQTCKIKWMLN